MKNKLRFTFLCMIMTLGHMYAQSYEPKYGFRIGANYSSILSSGDLPEDAGDHRLGAIAGFFAEYPFTDLVTIQPELQYSAQGNQGASYRLNYLQLPVLVKIKLADIFHVHIGPQLGFKVWEWERSDNYNTFEFSTIGGIGVYIAENFTADLRYSYGITDIFENRDNIPTALEGQNNYFQFTLGYRL